MRSNIGNKLRNRFTVFEIAFVLVRLDHVAGLIVDAKHSDVRRLKCSAYPIVLLIAFGSPYHSRPNGSTSEIRSTLRGQEQRGVQAETKS